MIGACLCRVNGAIFIIAIAVRPTVVCSGCGSRAEANINVGIPAATAQAKVKLARASGHVDGKAQIVAAHCAEPCCSRTIL